MGPRKQNSPATGIISKSVSKYVIIDTMEKNTKILISLTTLLLIGTSVFTYSSFVSFKPKISEQRNQVKGATSQDKTRLPYPQNYKIIGTSEEGNSQHITYRTTYSTQEIQDFYKNALTSSGWEISSKGNSGIFTKTNFKMQNRSLEVTASSQPNEDQADEKNTIVSILLTD